MEASAAGERRIDPADGRAYTQAEFVQQYGGTTEWDRATPAPAGTGAPAPAPAAPTGTGTFSAVASGATKHINAPPAHGSYSGGGGGFRGGGGQDRELRVSPKNGRCYDQSQFIKFFGGTVEWERAALAPPGVGFGGSPNQPGSGGGAPGGGKGGGAGSRPGDWNCSSCGFSNYANRFACHKCQAPKPGGGGGPAAYGSSGPGAYSGGGGYGGGYGNPY
eukprot:Hpha_TRINITY_DN14860_c2_g11::TRINITY_DN14860_c2_g11_i1::g.169460::m.169460